MTPALGALVNRSQQPQRRLCVERAQSLLHGSSLGLDAFAAEVGYVDGATLRALLLERLGRGVQELLVDLAGVRHEPTVEFLRSRRNNSPLPAQRFPFFCRTTAVEQFRNFRRHTIRGDNQGDVQMDVPLCYASSRVAKQTCDRKF
jgi:hypothetical protein